MCCMQDDGDDAALADRTVGQRAAAAAGSAGITKEQEMEERQRALILQKKKEWEERRLREVQQVPTVAQITQQVCLCVAVSRSVDSLPVGDERSRTDEFVERASERASS